MKKGSYFGEVEVLFSSFRTYSATTIVNTEMLSLERNKFLDILNQYPEVAKEVVNFQEFEKFSMTNA